jgi:hypothetical protein
LFLSYIHHIRRLNHTQSFLTLAEDAAGNFRPVAASRLVPEVAP